MSDFLAGAGVLLAALAAAAAILLPAGRLRSAAMVAALALFPVLILGDQWHSHQIADLRHDTGRFVALGVLALAVAGALAYVFRRWPVLLPLAIVAALPFRIPLHAGGDTANLLVPLYLVIAGGVLSLTLRDWDATRAAAPAGRAARWLPRVLAAVVVLYALQSLYSDDFSKGLQNACFFLVPFSLVYALLRDVEWDRKLLLAALWVIGVEAVAFVLVGSVEYLSRSLFWNDQVIRSNEFHTYFRVNSVFWDPNIYGRYLALAIVIVTAPLLWARERRDLALLTTLVAILWLGLAQTFSQSSFLALLAGLAVLAALRWSWRWTLGAVGVGVIAAVLVVLLVGGSGKIRLNVDTSGRANLISGGIALFDERPVWGYGSGSFQHAYRDHQTDKNVPVSISHTEPVTIAAEQGLLGLAAYVALLVAAFGSMASGLFVSPAGGTDDGGAEDAPARSAPPSSVTGPAGRYIARAAVLAAFVALLVHTMAYAGFFEDPIAWVLLAAGVSLGRAPVRDET